MAIPITVIIPVYNTADALERCIRSILEQTFSSVEIIAIDDGSTDGSGDMLDAFAAADTRLHVVHQQNSGVAAARNTAIAMARGEYLSFVDSDDYIDPKTCEILYTAAQESHADIVSGSMYRLWAGKTVLLKAKDMILEPNKTSYADMIDTCMFGNIGYRMSICGKLYKRYMFDTYHIEYLGKRMGDALFNIKALMVANKVQLVSEPLYYYHKRPGSITTSAVTDPSYPISHVQMVRYIQDFADENDLMQRVDRLLPAMYLRFLKIGLITVDQGSKYAYIYSVLKKLYAEDPNFKALLFRIKNQAKHKTLKEYAWAAYRNSFAQMCGRGCLRVASFLLWRQQKPWKPEI